MSPRMFAVVGFSGVTSVWCGGSLATIQEEMR